MTYVPQTYDVRLYETLHALMGQNNRAGYNPEHLTAERIAEAKALGYVKGRKHFKLTWEGICKHTELHREHRVWECAEGDAIDAAADAEAGGDSYRRPGWQRAKAEGREE